MVATRPANCQVVALIGVLKAETERLVKELR
jgi:hypothetical protein